MSYSDELALSVLFKKYSIFISKKIREYNLLFDYDDIFQESLILLNTAIEKYIDSQVPFYSYFMRMLSNMLITYRFHKNKEKYTIVYDNMLYEEGNVSSYTDPSIKRLYKGLTLKEITLSNLIYIKGWSAEKVSKEYGYTKAQVYYVLKKAKTKILKNYYDTV